MYETSVDEVVGILYAKDLLPFLKSSSDARPTLRAMLRTPVFVPESMTIDDLLHEFQRRKVHIAIVLDEYGGTAGLVTIEDLLEEIVGEIQDEYDVEEPLVECLDDEAARSTAGRRSTTCRPVGHQAPARGRGRVRHGRRPRVPPDRRGPAARRRGPLDGLRLTVETTDGRRVGKVLVVRELDVDDRSGDGRVAEHPRVGGTRRGSGPDSDRPERAGAAAGDREPCGREHTTAAGTTAY